MVNTPQGSGPRSDGSHIRTAANVHKVSCVTTVAAALAAAHGMAEWAANPQSVRSLQEWHAEMSQGGARRPVDLTTTVGSVVLPNPVLTASGTAGHGAELADATSTSPRLGAVVTKSLAP